MRALDDYMMIVLRKKRLLSVVELDIEPLSLLDFLSGHGKVTVGHGSHVPKEPSGADNHGNSGTNESDLVDGCWRHALLVVGGLVGTQELNSTTSKQGRNKVGRKVVVQELLSTHQVKWEVVSSPTNEEETQCVVES